MTAPARSIAAGIGVVAVIVMALLAVGCGGDSADTTTTGATAGAAPSLGPAKPKESAEQAESRIAKTVASGDCERIVALYPLSNAGGNQKARCDLLMRRLGDAEALGVASYGEGAAVIDYEQGSLTFDAPLIRDQDGLFHIVFLDIFLGEASTETKFDNEFDAVATDAVAALSEADCDAFAALSYRRFGPGALGEDALCKYVGNNPVKRILEVNPGARPKLYGGNEDYAFYGLGSPRAEYTIVMARQTDDGRPEGVEPLPADASEHAYVNIYPVNAAHGRGGGE